jgi:hypothetical protein
MYSETLGVYSSGYWRAINEAIAGLNELRQRYVPGVGATSDVAGGAPDLLS